MGWPDANKTIIKSLASLSPYYSGTPSNVKLLGYGPVAYSLEADGLHVTLPADRPGGNIAPVLVINF